MTDDERPHDPASLVAWMAAMDAYRDKTLLNSRIDDDYPPEQPARKTIVVAWRPGERVRLTDERVRLTGSDPDERGVVTQIMVKPSSVMYQVSWLSEKQATNHYDFELENAG